MAEEPQDDEVLELTEDQEIEESQEQDEANEPEGDEEEFEVQFGDEAAPASESDTPLIKHLRQQLRETQSRLREVEKAAPQTQRIEVGEKPTLSGCEYDEERFEAELDGWKERKAAAEAAE